MQFTLDSQGRFLCIIHDGFYYLRAVNGTVFVLHTFKLRIIFIRKNMEVILVHKQNTSAALIACASSHYCFDEIASTLPRKVKARIWDQLTDYFIYFILFSTIIHTRIFSYVVGAFIEKNTYTLYLDLEQQFVDYLH